jgi:DNA-binding CsgD family transcriptional regulator
MLLQNKLSKSELNILAMLLRGRREEIASLAGVSINTVNNTFQNLYQNPKVIGVAKELVAALKNTKNEDVEAIRGMITELSAVPS